MGLMVYLGTPHEPVNREVLADADWGGMLLLGTGVSMIYAGLDQGNRLDWLGSGTVAALLIGGGLLCAAFSDQRAAGSPALGPCQRAVLAQYRALADRHPALHAHQPVQFIAGAEFPRHRRPVAARTDRRAADGLWRAADVRAGAGVDLSAQAFRPALRAGHRPVGLRRGEPAGDAADARLGARRFRHRSRCCNRSGRHSPCCRSSSSRCRIPIRPVRPRSRPISR